MGYQPYVWIPGRRMLDMSKWVLQGAESRTYKTYVRFRSSHDDWGPLEDAIKAGCPSTPVMDDIFFKHRFAKQYRHPSLDKMLTRQRLTGEARTLMRCLRYDTQQKGLGYLLIKFIFAPWLHCSAGVNVPGIRLVDVDEGCLGLEFIEGSSVRYLIPAGTDEPRYNLIFHPGESEPEHQVIIEDVTSLAAAVGCVNKLTMETLLEKIGVEIAKLHRIDIIHGDLTTSNMMIRASNNDLVLVDFGLAYHSTLVEDKAVDLYVLERAFASTHPDSEHLFESILVAYANGMGKDWDQIKKRLDEVRLRGRKRTMVG